MLKYCIATALALMLVGCGNSHDAPGRANQPNPGNNTAKATLKGVAVDDLILNGVVSAYPAGDSGNVLATGRTSQTNGTYTLDVAYDGVVVVEVTCDNDSKMYNPATDTKKACIQGLELHSAAAVTPQSAPTVVNISPLSEIVVQRLETLGISEENLETATEEVKQVFGADPLADNPTTGTYSEIIDAFHETAKDSNKSISEVVAAVADDFKDGNLGDTNTTKELAQTMQEQNLSTPLSEGNGTVTFSGDALAFTADELTGKRYYIVEAASWGVLDFNQTHLTYQSLFDEEDSDVSPYSIEGGKLHLLDENLTVERVLKSANYAVLKVMPGNEMARIYINEADARNRVIAQSANFAQMVEDSASDSASDNPGFELTSLTTTIKDHDLVVIVKAAGNIKDAIDNAPTTEGYENYLQIEINDFYRFGLTKNGFFEDDNGNAVKHKVLDDGSLLFRIASDVLPISEIMSVSAEVGEALYSENNESDEHVYDKIETFVTQKSIPATETMFADKVFYSSWMEDNQTAYAKYALTDTNITVTTQMGNEIETEKGTYAIEDGVAIATVEGKEHRVTPLIQTAGSLTVLIEDDDGKNIETWYLNKPAGYPDFVPGSNNHAPAVDVKFPPITMAGVPLDLKGVLDINDSDGDALNMGIMQVPNHGDLKINGEATVAGNSYDMEQIESAVYLPTADFNGMDTAEINVSDAFSTTTKSLTLSVLDENNTLPISALDLNGRTFYATFEDDNGVQQYVTITASDANLTITPQPEGVPEVLPYEITEEGKVLAVDDQQMYLLVKNNNLWKFAVKYTNGDPSEIEVWFLNPAKIPNFPQ